MDDFKGVLNGDLSNVTRWFEQNKLTLIVKKTKFMVIGSSRKLNSIDAISIDISGECLEECNSFKYLGAIINYQITWDDHFNYISKQILKKLSLLRRIKAYLSVSTRVLFSILSVYYLSLIIAM